MPRRGERFPRTVPGDQLDPFGFPRMVGEFGTWMCIGARALHRSLVAPVINDGVGARGLWPQDSRQPARGDAAAAPDVLRSGCAAAGVTAVVRAQARNYVL